MSDEFKKQQKRYFHDIKKHFSGKPAARRYFRSLRANMEHFIADNSVSDITALYTQFGTAEEIAEAYLEEISPLELSKHIRRLRIFRIAACILIVLLLLFLVYFVHGVMEGYPVEAEIIFEVQPGQKTN